MTYLNDFFHNQIIGIAFTGFAVAQVLKVIFSLIAERRIDFSRFTGSGGMPSSHASFVMALSAGVGRVEGFDSVLFAVCIVFSCVVMYDAAGVRRAVGQQARILNMMVEHWEDDDIEFMNRKLKELLGHTPVEVFAGAILGIMIGMVMPVS